MSNKMERRSNKWPFQMRQKMQLLNVPVEDVNVIDNIQVMQMHLIMGDAALKLLQGMEIGKLIIKLLLLQVEMILYQIVKFYVQNVMNSLRLMEAIDLFTTLFI
jgi:hypothetical protein